MILPHSVSLQYLVVSTAITLYNFVYHSDLGYTSMAVPVVFIMKYCPRFQTRPFSTERAVGLVDSTY
jgi:hypothetical protein